MAHKDLMKIALVLTIAASACTANAGVQTITGSITIGTSSFSPSTNVTLTAAAGSAAYSIYASHINGSRLYWGGSANSRIYWNTKAIGTSTAQGANSTDDMSTNNAWSSL
jgi:hypothetical protein